MDRLLSVKTSSQLGGSEIAETEEEDHENLANNDVDEPCESNETSEEAQVKLENEHEN